MHRGRRTREGVLRQSLKRFGVIHEAVMFSILKQEYEGSPFGGVQ